MLNDFDNYNLPNKEKVEPDEALATAVLVGCFTMFMLFALLLILGGQ